MAEKTAKDLLAEGDEALVQASFGTGEFAVAEELFQTARRAAAEVGDRSAQADADNGLGLLAHYRNIAKLMAGQQTDPAEVQAEEELFRSALITHQELGNVVGVAHSLFGIGLVYQVLHRDWSSAMPYYWQVLELAEVLEENGDLYARSEIHRHVGFYYMVEDVQPAEALRHLNLSLELRERLGDPRRIPSALEALGEAEAVAGNRDRALALLTEATDRARAAGLSPARIEGMEQTLRDVDQGVGIFAAGPSPDGAETVAGQGDPAAGQ
ncbi:MAG TPA: hypothetical protein VGX23_28880 [Actinocrinis sp.]|nr:hypothetical protein [Actinocrinis sp.]